VSKVSAGNLLSGKNDPVLWFKHRNSKMVANPIIARRREAVRLARLAAVDKDVRSWGPEWVPPTVVTGEHMAVPFPFSKRYVVAPLVIVSGETYMGMGVYYAPLDWFSAGLIMSKKAMQEQRASGGKMASGNIRYSTSVLYGMPAPANDSPALRERIAAKAKECVEARPGPAATCMKATNMPDGLAKLHRQLDALVDAWWG